MNGSSLFPKVLSLLLRLYVKGWAPCWRLPQIPLFREVLDKRAVTVWHLSFSKSFSLLHFFFVEATCRSGENIKFLCSKNIFADVRSRTRVSRERYTQIAKNVFILFFSLCMEVHNVPFIVPRQTRLISWTNTRWIEYEGARLLSERFSQWR